MKNGKSVVLDLSSFNTSKVTNMESMFYSLLYRNDSSIALDLSNFDTSNVTNMSGMFYQGNITN
ncbi:MAG: DUF285 domain-containing protein [Clostridium sp.]|nr:MAG: DUF285 domain-containing protein [Clostridium sp.]